MGRPLEWRIIGEVLLSKQDYMDNEELGSALDGSRILKVPRAYNAEDWEEALTRNPAAMNYISDIRKWVKRSRKDFLKKAA